MTAVYDRLTEQQKREIRMYGVTETEMREAVEQSLTFRHCGPAMMAASLMSDCQEMLSSDNGGSYDFMVVEDVRQALNRAKWILFEYCDKK
jgi:ornithine carbamoyltransferase